MPTTVRYRLAAATGAAYILLILVGNTLSTRGASTAAHPTGAAVLRDVERQMNSAAATAGFVMEILGFTLFIVFLGYLAAVLRTRRGQPDVMAGTAVIAGVVMLAVKLGSAAPMGALMLDRHQVTPLLARVLSDVNSVAFVISWIPMGVFVAALALALRTAGLAGRPTAYSGAVIGLAGIALGVLGVNDPLNANPVPFLLGLIWILVVSARLAFRRGETIGTAPVGAAPAYRPGEVRDAAASAASR
ncbi:MAG TPA: hypothetical protein VH857_07255 [Actinomycetes bacterium]|jgi:hypothetical protein|nr:hypothetical protein [Actinomycetes bacterium]